MVAPVAAERKFWVVNPTIWLKVEVVLSPP